VTGPGSPSSPLDESAAVKGPEAESPAPESPAPESPALESPAIESRRERQAAAVLLAAALALRLFAITRYAFDSDEAQHLHVMWGWTQGLLPYRDFFDNHTPLFHLLYAPLLAALGETPRILFWMRLAVVPLHLLALALTFRLGAGLLGRRSALWGTVLLAWLPPFFYRTLEFRTDDLWALLWLAALVLLLTGRPRPGRFFAAGLAIGAAFGVSLKTIPLALGLALGAPPALLLARRRNRPGTPGPGRAWRAAGLVAACVAGAFAVPLGLVAYFSAHGALAAMRYGTVGHNLLATARGWTPALRLLALAVGGAGLYGGTRRASRTAEPALRRRRLVLVWSVGLYLLALWELWPIVTSQTYLPVEPAAALLLAHAALGWGRSWSERSRALGRGRSMAPEPAATTAPAARIAPDRELALERELALDREIAPGRGIAAGLEGAAGRGGRLRAWLPLAALLLLAGGLLLRGAPLRRSDTGPEVALIADALRLTGPGDPILDFKGETVYRRRPYFYVLETITRSAIARGVLPDTIPEAIAATGACVAVADHPRLPSRARAFLLANFVPVGNLRVCGQILAGSLAGGLAGGARAAADSPNNAAGSGSPGGLATRPTGAPVDFSVRLPARYALVTPAGAARGILDGTPYDGPRQLAAGPHSFVPDQLPSPSPGGGGVNPAPSSAAAPAPLALVWAQAIERGFTPFAPLRRGTASAPLQPKNVTRSISSGSTSSRRRS
jgi:hypothetical protein